MISVGGFIKTKTPALPTGLRHINKVTIEEWTDTVIGISVSVSLYYCDLKHAPSHRLLKKGERGRSERGHANLEDDRHQLSG